MIRIALVEDDPLYQKQLKEYLERYASEKDEHFTVSIFSDGDEIAEVYRPVWDIILMDIEMQFMNGLTAAGHIREKDKDVIIIFITQAPQYAIRGYSVNALDYVLKPVSYFSFSERIDRALMNLKDRSGRARCVLITDGEGSYRVQESHILYVEIDGRMLVYHTDNRVYRTWNSMAKAEQELDQRRFVRCNKGILINLEHVDAIIGNDVMVAGVALPISRAKKTVLLDALNVYMNEVGR